MVTPPFHSNNNTPLQQFAISPKQQRRAITAIRHFTKTNYRHLGLDWDPHPRSPIILYILYITVNQHSAAKI
jgi:hypothetical protein